MLFLILGVIGVAFTGCAAWAPGPPPTAAPPAIASAPATLPPDGEDGERWTGLVVEPVTEALARSANLPRVEGLYVRAVEPESPTARAGVQEGDVLLLVGGTYVGDVPTLNAVLATLALGSTVGLGFRREAEPLTVVLPVERPPGGRLLTVIEPPGGGLLGLAADGAGLLAWGPVPGGADRGIVPIQLPGGPPSLVRPRPIGAPDAERVIAADAERVYLGWAGTELHVDVYDIASERVGQLAVVGAESLANRCRPRGLTRVGGELWMACQRPEGPAVAAIDLATGRARVEPLPATYVGGLAFDGEAVLWLCCATNGRIELSRTVLGSGSARTFPLRGPIVDVAADAQAVYLLGADGRIYAHKPWR